MGEGEINILTSLSLSFLPLIICQCSKLAETKWKPEGKETWVTWSTEISLSQHGKAENGL